MTKITAASPAVVTAAQLACVLGCAPATLNKYALCRQIPAPDHRGDGNRRLWKLATIRAWRADVAAALVPIMATKPIPLNTAA